MPLELELEEEIIREEQDRRVTQRRDRNSLAIAEVVGRNPAKKPADPERIRLTPKQDVRFPHN